MSTLALRLPRPWARALILLAIPVACATSWLAASPVRAAGVEDTVGGAEGLGRAANFGRSNDFMAVVENPANLAVARPSVGLEFRIPWLRACFQRIPDPEIVANSTGEDPNAGYRRTIDPETGEVTAHHELVQNQQGHYGFPEVCNRGFILPTGNFGWAESFGKFGFGAGFFTPAAAGSTEYGPRTIVTRDPNLDYAGGEATQEQLGMPTPGGLQAPNRQLSLKRLALAGFLMFGVGAQPTWWLRLGVSTGAGMVEVRNTTVVSTLGGQFNDQEVTSELHARDWIVGRATGSTVMTPLPGLELFTVFQFHSDARAHGDMKLTANGIRGVDGVNCRQPPGSPPEAYRTTCTVDNVTLEVPFNPLEVTFGVRYALLRNGRQDTLDPLRDEWFDIEVDVNYAKTSNVDEFRVTTFPEGDENPPAIRFFNADGQTPRTINREVVVPKNWRDTWTVRAGMDINIVPERFAVRFGGSYATNAVPTGYMNIDYWPVRKIGAHAGFSLQLSEHYLMHVGYAHLFYEDRFVGVGEGRVREVANQMPNLSQAVNEGYYSAAQDIFSLQVNYLF